jgi:hypothetical protein
VAATHTTPVHALDAVQESNVVLGSAETVTAASTEPRSLLATGSQYPTHPFCQDTSVVPAVCSVVPDIAPNPLWGLYVMPVQRLPVVPSPVISLVLGSLVLEQAVMASWSVLYQGPSTPVKRLPAIPVQYPG